MATTAKASSVQRQKNREKLSSRDLVTLGVFSVLFIVIAMFVVGLCSMSIVAYLASCAIAAIPAGIVWVYVHVRIPRFGTSLVMATVFALAIFLMGSGWPMAVALIFGGLLSEAARKVAGPGRFSGIAIGYGLFMASWSVGLFAPMITLIDYYRELQASNNIDPAFTEALFSALTPETLALIALGTFAGAIVGASVGRAVFRKHFRRAGVA